MTTANTNPRASLLAGLRTGGVRSTSANIPHTAALGGSFNINRFPSQQHINPYDGEENDIVAEISSHHMFANRAMPMTAAVDGPNNRFSQQQRGMNPNSVPFSPAFAHAPLHQQQQYQAQAQALQMQMLQMEMLKIQTVQAQQYQAAQAEMIAQAQRQQQQQALSQARERRISLGFAPPASAGPTSSSFDLRSAALSAQMRRANQAEQVKSQLNIASSDDQVPMTAALGGRFGSRTTSINIPTNSVAARYIDEQDDVPPTPSSTTVISGGTSLGNSSSNNVYNSVPSKSDSASSWRRGGNNNSVLSGMNRAVTSPSVRVTPPSDTQRVSPPPVSPATASGAPKFRPQPLHFSPAVSQSLPTVAVDSADDESDEYNSSNSSSPSTLSHSSPTTPQSAASSNEMSLSPREEASKKLYEGLGMGRPLSAMPSEGQQQVQHPIVSVATHRLASQPTRQPRGPPSGNDELGPKNFATRIRRKAIGGLGMLMDARGRREFVEAY